MTHTFSSQRYIPLPIRRRLRQEVNFGCAICGCPIIEYHHIIPWIKTHQHNPTDMIVLCPTHAHRADMREYEDEYLRELKKSPHNLIMVSDAFAIQTEDVTVSIASNKYVNIPRILVVDDFDIISLTKENQYPQLDVNFFDVINQWIAIIYQNLWYVDRKYVWDIEYKPRHLTIRCKPRQISLDVQIVEDVIYLRGHLYFNGYKIEATKNELFLGGRNALAFTGSTFEGSTLANNTVGISIRTGARAR